jgi:hypothetical protein
MYPDELLDGCTIEPEGEDPSLLPVAGSTAVILARLLDHVTPGSDIRPWQGNALECALKVFRRGEEGDRCSGECWQREDARRGRRRA